MRTYTLRAAVAGCIAALALWSCQKESAPAGNEQIPEGKAKMLIYLMDDPIPFTRFLVDIRQVAVKIDTGQKHWDRDYDDQWDDDFCGRNRQKHNSSVFWDTLDIQPGVYDLLELRNGVDTLLASGIIPQGKVLKVRIALGPDNAVYTDSTTSYPLVIWGSKNYVEVNIRADDISVIDGTQFSLWLDFNLQRSVYFWSGRYYLKPFLKPFNDKKTAKLQGRVLPKGASPLVKAFSNADTLNALPGRDGRYLIRGVRPGIYSVHFTGHRGYKDTTVTGIEVNGWSTHHVPTVTLRK